MTTPSFTPRLAATAGLFALLTACGGGNDPIVSTGPAGGGVTVPTTAAQQASFISDYGNGIAALNTYGGLTSTAFLDLFDSAFLDAGYSKAQVSSNLTQEAAAMAIAADLSSFPAVKLSALSIGACDANNICTLTATATNADADTTAVTFTTKVRLQDGKFRLYGDQAATAA